MPISSETTVRVTHADITLQKAFYNSVDHWHHGEGSPILIDGHCTEDVSVPDHGMLHVTGDLSSKITAVGFHEIVVSGDVKASAEIHASDFCHVFVGGTFAGSLHAADSLKLWIGGDFTGDVETGTPSTQMHVERDFSGRIGTACQQSLLYLVVDGFVSNANITQIANVGYTQFHASINVGDVRAGIYPTTDYCRRTDHGNSFSRWSVARERAV